MHELIAWELDEYPYRNTTMSLKREGFAKQIERAQEKLAERECHANGPALLAAQNQSIDHLFAECKQRSDLQAEYEGLDWTLGVVDLRRLLAFQRRLVFSTTQRTSHIPGHDDWPQLLSLAIGFQRSTKHHVVGNVSAKGDFDVSLHSSNPDLQLRLSPNAGRNGHLPLSLHGGSPFFEVAELCGRWFLRDGYHRAYRLLQAGVHRIPAVVIYARTIEELGATEPWFFSEEQLFSDRPPRVIDFLDENLVLRYKRTALRKVIRIRVEESLEAFEETDEEQGEDMSIATKRGDGGQTGLAGGVRISKADLRVEAYGTVDELNTVLGFARSICTNKEIYDWTEGIQRTLFRVGSALATPTESKKAPPSITTEDVEALTKLVHQIEATEGILGDWSLPGAHTESAAYEIARTVCRRAERNTVRLASSGVELKPEILAYLNRLSDVIWLFGRLIEVNAGVDARLRSGETAGPKWSRAWK